jgi:hypothetical protein
MNYCSIDDAWGYTKKTEHFSSISDDKKPIKQTPKQLSNCPDAFYHVINCPSCYNKMKNLLEKPKTNMLGTIENAIEDNKDLIVLVLTGASIVLFFNLINNITKN